MLDLDAFPELEAAVSSLADKSIAYLKNGRTGWIKVARPRAISEEYGEAGIHGEGGEAEMHDLMDFAHMLVASGEATLAEPAKQVDEAIRKVVRYFMRGPCRPHASGISIYFPREQISSLYANLDFAKDCRWPVFLKKYLAALTA